MPVRHSIDPIVEPRSLAVGNRIPPTSVYAFLEHVYLKCRRGSEQEIADVLVDVLEFVDQVLDAGELSLCDELLLKVNLSRCPASVWVAMLAATLPVREQLVSRAGFMQCVQQELSRLNGADSAARTLRGLE